MFAKIEFKIISSTGEDDNFKANELNYHGPAVGGWRSPSNCTFPQELILQLKMLAVLHRIQILAHQYLIPQKIEICTSSALDPDDPVDYFEYLGFVTFSDNEASRFRSRELKSITIPSKKAKYVKLRIHSNHANVKNIHNQVGLVAVNVLGEAIRAEAEEAGDPGSGPRPTSDALDADLTLSPYDDLAFEMYVDQETAKIMKILESRKFQAICEKRFAYANALDAAIESLRTAGEILGRCEQEKMRAISLEDYDKAKAKKIFMDDYRKKVYAALHVRRLLGTNEVLGSNVSSQGNRRHRGKSPDRTPDNFSGANDEFSATFRRKKSDGTGVGRWKNFRPARSRSQNSMRQSPEMISAPYLRLPEGVSSSTSSPLLRDDEKKVDSKDWAFSDNCGQASALSDPAESPSYSSGSSGADEWSPSANQDSARDFRPLPSTLRNGGKLLPLAGEEKNERLNYSNSWSDFSSSKKPAGIEETSSGIKPSSSEHKSFGKAKPKVVPKSSFDAYEDRMLPALKSYHTNEVVRECQLAFGQLRKSSLSEKEKKQAMLPISVFGMEMIEKFYSKNFSDKEDSLIKLREELHRFSQGEDPSRSVPVNKVARAATLLLHRALRDKVFTVYRCAAETVRFFFKDFVPHGVSTSEIARSLEKLLPELLAKSGDVTPRIHNMAAHTLLSIAECEEVRRLNIIPKHLSRPLTSAVHPRLALSRLEMVEQLIFNLGISTDKKSGLTCRTLAEFGSSGLHHPAEAVRKVSERILIRVYEANPRIVRKQLPPDDNVTRRNLLYRHLFQEFDFVDLQRNLSPQTAGAGLSKAGPFLDREIGSRIGPEGNAGGLEETQALENIKKIRADPDKNTETHPDPVNDTIISCKTGGRNESRRSGDTFLPKARGNALPDVCGPNKTKNSTKPRALASGLSELPKVSIKSPETVKNKRARNLESDAASVRCPPLADSATPTTPATRRQPKKCGQRIPQLKKTETDARPKKTGSSLRKNKVGSGSPSLPSGIPLPACADKSSSKEKASSAKQSGDGSGKQGGRSPAQETEGSARLSHSMLASIRNFKETEDSEELGGAYKNCIFCSSSDRWTTEDSLNHHYLNECLMLTTCTHCKEVTEISELTNHLLVECKWKHLFRKCKICQEAISKEFYDSHNCKAFYNKIYKSRCPFCHTNFEEADNGWRKHLVENTCSLHPRNKNFFSSST